MLLNADLSLLTLVLSFVVFVLDISSVFGAVMKGLVEFEELMQVGIFGYYRAGH